MMAQYFFDFWGRPKEARQFDIAAFCKPFFISPLVFLPMLGLIPDTSEPAIGNRHFFVWLNAFQNGFFWTVVYEKVQQRFAG